MSRKVKRKSKPKPRQKVEPKSEIAELDMDDLKEKVSQFKRWALILTVAIILTGSAIKILLAYQTYVVHKRSLSRFDSATLVISIIGSPLTSLYWLLSGLKKISLFPLEEAYRRLRNIVLAYSTLFSLNTLVLMYLTGAAGFLSHLVYISAPKVGQAASSIIAFIINAIVSGVIGNFVYDILKKKVYNQAK